MVSGSASEVVHCPNCKEDVPKTLYCLNCGFPLYKDEQPKEEAKAEMDAKPVPAKLVEPAEEDTALMVDDEEEEPAKLEEPKVEVTVEAPAVTPEVKEETPVVEATPVQPADPVAEPEIKEAESAPEPASEPATPEEMTPELAPIVEVEESKPIEAVVSVVDATPMQAEDPKPVEVPSEPLSKGTETSKLEALELVEDFPAPKTFVPDPLTKDLMENIARNISLKLKLVKLYRDGTIKEETFTKLFTGYASEGKIWSSRREEILKKLATEIEEMEDAFEAASDSMELLEVRKSIGEALEGEYTAKAPAYKWDIDNFDNMIGEKRNKIVYLENISSPLTSNEFKELRELASLQYNTLESLQVSDDELLATIKDSLYEAIKILG